MGFYKENKIRCIISLAVYLLCGGAVFLPHVTVVNTNLSSSDVESVSKSIIWYISEAGVPEIYATALTVYFIVSALLLVSVFLRNLNSWPILISAVFSALFLVFHGFLTGIVFYAVKNTVGSCSLTVWAWLFILLILGNIINLFMFCYKVKKNR